MLGILRRAGADQAHAQLPPGPPIYMLVDGLSLSSLHRGSRLLDAALPLPAFLRVVFLAKTFYPGIESNTLVLLLRKGVSLFLSTMFVHDASTKT